MSCLFGWQADVNLLLSTLSCQNGEQFYSGKTAAGFKQNDFASVCNTCGNKRYIVPRKMQLVSCLLLLILVSQS